MATEHILGLLIQERDKLDRAIAALRSGAKIASASTGGGGGKAAVAAPKKRHVSAGARRKMAAAQKARWAAIKAAK
jgi:hypothetical protein